MRILKFGGTSLANAAVLRRVLSLVREARGEGEIAVVASAMAGVTDTLAAAVVDVGAQRGEVLELLRRQHRQCLAELAPRDSLGRQQLEYRLGRLRRRLGTAASRDCPAARDAVLASGEQLMVPVLAAALRAAGFPAVTVDARRLIATDSRFGDANVDLERTRRRARRLFARLSRGVVAVIPGFLGSDHRGRVTTLGRGGSDTTATTLGAALQAERVDIFTDVDGVLSAPPQLVPGASVIPALTFAEALAIAAHGGKVLHHKAIAPCRQAGVEVVVRNTFRPQLPGTVIAQPQQVPNRVACVTGRPWEEVDGALALLAVVGDGVEGRREVATRARTALVAAGVPVRGAPTPALPATFLLAVERHALAAAVVAVHGALLGTTARVGSAVAVASPARAHGKR